MIVVSNTSPLTNLAAIGQFHLLHALYGEIQIAQEVHAELNFAGRRWPGAMEVEASDWIHVHSVKNRALIEVLRLDLDRGEAASIALAHELSADLVLLDEREGRRIAQRLALKCVGVLGVLIEARASGFIEQIRPQLDLLRSDAGFFIGDALYNEVLKTVGE